MAESNGEVRGIVPLGRLRSRWFGDTLVSTPFCVYGGIVAADQKSWKALTRAACDLAKRLRVDRLELRNQRRQQPEWPCNELYVRFRKALEPTAEENLKAIPRKQRAMVRKGIKAGLEAEVESGIERFYTLYSESVRNLGTPVFSRRYFRVLREVFGDASEVLTVSHNGSPLASVMSFYYRDEVLPYYGGGVAAARALAANDFMYWELMRRSCERGVRFFDFGRSKREVGSYRFKKHWGFEPEPLFYESKLVAGDRIAEVNPLNPRYQRAIRAWRRLPLRVTQWIGPWISRHLG